MSLNKNAIGSLDKSVNLTLDSLTVTTATMTSATLGGDAISKIKTGTYTGDGTLSQAITGIGFLPKVLIIEEYSATDGGNINGMSIKTTDNPATFMNWHGNSGDKAYDDSIISLDADGFTVDDQNTDRHPNKNAATYMYTALG